MFRRSAKDSIPVSAVNQRQPFDGTESGFSGKCGAARAGWGMREKERLGKDRATVLGLIGQSPVVHHLASGNGGHPHLAGGGRAALGLLAEEANRCQVHLHVTARPQILVHVAGLLRPAYTEARTRPLRPFSTSRHRDSSPVSKVTIPARPAFDGQSLEMAIANLCPESDSSTAATCRFSILTVS